MKFVISYVWIGCLQSRYSDHSSKHLLPLMDEHHTTGSFSRPSGRPSGRLGTRPDFHDELPRRRQYGGYMGDVRGARGAYGDSIAKKARY
jgi:hypothetical protein